MRTLSVACLLILALLAGPARAVDYRDVPEHKLFVGNAARYQHLEYVGFYASDMAHWSFASLLAPITNLTWVEQDTIAATVERLSRARDSNIQAVISLQRLVFDTTYQLQGDYLHTVAELQQSILHAGLQDSIAMVYPLDEPYLLAERDGGPGRDAMRHALAQLNAELHALFPDTPIGVIFNKESVLRAGFTVPASFDWVGFDCYANLYDCNGKPFNWYYGKLLAKMTPQQRLMAVPQTWVRYEDYQRGDNEPGFVYRARLERLAAELRKRFLHHYEIALSDPRFVAFVPFLFSMEAAPGAPRHEGFGLDQFAARFDDGGLDFLQAVIRSAYQVKSGRHAYPNLARSQTEFSLERPPQYLKGKILDVSDDGLVSAWAMDESLPHKALRMQLRAYRDGELVWTSSVRRSFVFDTTLKDRHAGGRPALGVHGYRQQLPEALVQSLGEDDLELVVRAYYDGGLPDDYRDVDSWTTMK